MKKKERLYAVIGGCVGAVLTMVVCSFFPLGVQSQPNGNFDKITCSELEVVYSDGTRGVRISVGSLGGKIDLRVKKGLRVTDDNRVPYLVGLDAFGGLFIRSATNGSHLASISGGHGGIVAVSDERGKGQVIMDVTAAGDGAVYTYDRDRKHFKKLGR